jgi:cysteine-S-conjugate beta-lyase
MIEMPRYDFDQIVDRSGSDSGKWSRYSADVLPLWVADMDFLSPPEVIEALHRRIDHGVFGYGSDPVELRELICERLLRRYNWEIAPHDIIFMPGLVSGFNIAARAIGDRGDGVLICTPVYHPFLHAPANQHRLLQNAPLASSRSKLDGLETIDYEMDLDAIEDAITERTRLHILCNPHNPVGRAYTRAELESLATTCLSHDVIICSDEIHCDLLLGETQHVPIASLHPEIARRTITLMAPSKTYNLPGLACSYAVITDPDLRAQFQSASAGIVPHVNLLGYVAAITAYSSCDEWERRLRDYLTANRDYLLGYLRDNLPSIAATVPEATFLGWLDCGALDLPGNPQEFFLEEARVAFNEGATFGEGGEGFVRFNFGCPRATVQLGLDRMAESLAVLSRV